jgi:hypothetical protein
MTAERADDPEIRRDDGQTLVSLIDEQRRIARHRKEGARKPVFGRPRTSPTDLPDAPALQIGDAHGLVDPVAYEDPSIPQLAYTGYPTEIVIECCGRGRKVSVSGLKGREQDQGGARHRVLGPRCQLPRRCHLEMRGMAEPTQRQA